MRKIASAFLAISLLATNPASGIQVDTREERDPEFEQEVYERLARLDPEAVAFFKAATDAFDNERLEDAEKGFNKVLDMVGEFPDADRRLSYVEMRLDKPAEALRYAKRAYKNDSSPINQAALAGALVFTGDPTNFADALHNARNAALMDPEDVFVQHILLWVGITTENREAIRMSSARLMTLAPDFAPAFFFAGMIAGYDGDWDKAEELLVKSQELGFPEESVQSALDALRELKEQDRLPGVARIGLYGLAAWVGGLAALFLVGIGLSRIMLDSVSVSGDGTFLRLHIGEGWVRSVYRAVIAITSVAFYASIPLLILAVVVLAGALLYALLTLRFIPIKLLLIVAVFAFFTLVAIVRSVFARIPDDDPGRSLSREEAPRLWALTEEVAGRLDTRPVEAIYLTPGPEIAVMERGGIRRKLRGKGQRCLILGLGVLPNMLQKQLMAILGHEYGHFSNRDTAGGNLANQVRFSIHQMAFGLAVNGLGNWYNPAWLFVNGYYRVFLRVTLGASRLQEILADRYAAIAYGASDFASALRHVVRRSLEFDMQLGHEFEKMTGGEHRIQNVYTLPALEQNESTEDLEKQLVDAMSRPTSPYDSHPAPNERIKLLEAVDNTPSSPSSTEPVWELFPDPEALQIEMTGYIQANIDAHRAMMEEQQEAG